MVFETFKVRILYRVQSKFIEFLIKRIRKHALYLVAVLRD